MKKQGIICLNVFLIFCLLLVTPAFMVRGEMFQCPSTKAGDTKILKVTTVDEEGLEGIFGSNWREDLNNSFGGAAATLGARFKSVVQGIDTNSTYVTFFGSFPACNITVDAWEFTTNFSSVNKTTQSVYVVKDPANVTFLAQSISTFFAAPSNVTIPWVAAILGQLAVPPTEYLDGMIWEEGWTTPGQTVRHDVTAGYTVPLTSNTYLQNCTEIWTFYDNGALIGYKLINNESKTVYEYQIELPQLGIPGFELPIFFGIMGISIIGLVFIFKRKELN
jgi:hypothetical protein